MESRIPVGLPVRHHWLRCVNYRQMPVSVGFYDYKFDDIFDQGPPQGLSTLSFVPGLELEKQITSRWRLKPYFSAGAGGDLEGGGYAWIYDVGLRSRFRIGEDKGVEFALVIG